MASYIREDLTHEVMAALQGFRGAPFRRSRHATTWKVNVAGTDGGPTTIFVKQLDSARGLAARAKAKSRARRSIHVLRISEGLRRRNFGVPDVLLIGENRDSRAEVIVTSAAPGFMVTRWMNPAHGIDVLLRRRILHQLGAEVARLHLKGYIHGDLTPYNIFATADDHLAISFIDHEGTEKTARMSINLARNRMRNLVQLGHFDSVGVSRTDKMRVFHSYATAIGLAEKRKRQSLRRLLKMIERRRDRDRAIKRDAPHSAMISEEAAAARG